MNSRQSEAPPPINVTTDGAYDNYAGSMATEAQVTGMAGCCYRPCRSALLPWPTQFTCPRCGTTFNVLENLTARKRFGGWALLIPAFNHFVTCPECGKAKCTWNFWSVIVH